MMDDQIKKELIKVLDFLSEINHAEFNEAWRLEAVTHITKLVNIVNDLREQLELLNECVKGTLS